MRFLLGYKEAYRCPHLPCAEKGLDRRCSKILL